VSDDAVGEGDADTYVHDPGAVEPIGNDPDAVGDPDAGEPEGAAQPRNTPEPEGEFDWRGWLLVAAIVVAFLLVPGALYLLPSFRGVVASIGLGLRHTYLVFPLIPAFLLGAIAVWSAVRARGK